MRILVFVVAVWFASASRCQTVGDPAIVYSTYLGGKGRDRAPKVTVDRRGNTYIVGTTESADFRVTPRAVQRANAGGTCREGIPPRDRPRPCSDVFVTKLNHSGAPVYSTYLGGSSDDVATAVAVDDDGNAYVAGSAGSRDFPLVNALFSEGASFISKLSPDGSTLLFSTRIGASLAGIAVDRSGNLCFAGSGRDVSR